MSMDYFRRPQIAGNALRHLPFAAVRGAVRRNDPDGVSLDPYFPVSAGQTLTLKIDGYSFVITFPDNNMSVNDILSTINPLLFTAGATRGIASEVDGVLIIQSMTKGSQGWVEITGGTAAAALGFDLRLGRIRSAGGDLLQAGELRIGNPHGASFPVKYENLSTDSFVRSLGRLATNADVLYSDVSRYMPRGKLIGTVAYGGQTTIDDNHVSVTCPSGERIYIGLSVLDANSTQEVLSNYFVLLDSVTGRPATSQVVAVVRGDVVGPPPYMDATDLLSAGNVLGRSFTRAGPINIDTILNGRVIYTADGSFAGVKVGDLARIDGEDGTVPTDPWDNRGLRWVVESISSDAKSVTVRPMSASELRFYSANVDDSQPIVDLNSKLPIGLTFGTITFLTGTYLDSLKLILSPPMPPGASCQVWAKVARNHRDMSGGDDSFESLPALRTLFNDIDAATPGLITRPEVAWNGTSKIASFHEFYVRWRGKSYRIPAQSHASVDDTVFYWDPVDALVRSQSWQAPEGTWPLLKISSNTGTDLTRILADGGKAYTVGALGQFPTIQQAFAHIGALATLEPTEIVLLDDQTFTGPVYVPSGNFRIRGAHPGVSLSKSGTWTGGYFDSTALSLVVSDLRADLSGGMQLFNGTVQRNCVAYNVSGLDSSMRSFVSPDLDLSTDAAGVGYLTTEGKSLRLGQRASEVYLSKAGSQTQVDGTLRVKQNVTFEVDLLVSGDASVTGDLSVTGAGSFHGGLSSDAGLSVTGNINATADITAGRDLKVTRNADIDGTLDVAGAVTARATVVAVNSLLSSPTLTTTAQAPWAQLDTDGTTGFLRLSAAGSASKVFALEHLNTLVYGGVADSLHSHPQYAGQGTPPASAAPPAVVSEATGVIGIVQRYAREDHQHPHGDLIGGALHAVATGSAAGFMSGADKTKLDALSIVSGGTHIVTGYPDVSFYNVHGDVNIAVSAEPFVFPVGKYTVEAVILANVYWGTDGPAHGLTLGGGYNLGGPSWTNLSSATNQFTVRQQWQHSTMGVLTFVGHTFAGQTGSWRFYAAWSGPDVSWCNIKNAAVIINWRSVP